MRRRPAVDWPEIRRRLDAVGRALEGEFAPSAEKRRAILEERARVLAAEPAPPPGPGFEALEFTLAREHYLVETGWVREVHPVRELTPLPGTPAFVLGIVHVRGRVVSVLDLKAFFALPSAGLSELNKAIVLAEGGMEFGILADAIVGVRRVLDDELQPALPTLTDVRAEYLRGITRRSEAVLDARTLLNDPAIIVEADPTG